MADMTQNIQILPEALCNQIAAGEVVERPASVVKELVENALDAGAGCIRVEVEKGGKRLIRVTDDGCGMGREDAFLCLERHATSKVRSEQDLFRLRTLGFRGEALPSIAGVSRLTLRTRTADHLAGWEIQADGGTIRRTGEVGTPAGTSIEVRNLFFNTPARRKFLRRDETELGHVGDVMTRLALGHPGVRFRFAHDDRVLWEVNRQTALRERAAELLGRAAVRDMVPLDVTGGDGLRLHGLVSRPNLSRSGNSGMYTFINGRFIRDRVVQHALAEGYRHLLARGRYPVVVLFLELDPAQVDVNVHPTKHEVRFRAQAGVHDFIMQSLRERLQAATPQSPSRRDAVAAKPTLPKRPGTSERVAEPAFSYPVAQTEAPSSPRQEESLEPLESAKPDEPGDSVFRMPEQQVGTEGAEGFFSSLEVIGQYQRSYLVCQANGELILIDQHAAHERITFERIKKQYQAKDVERQLLLFPLVMEFEFRQARLIDEMAEQLHQLGFDLEHFGGNSYALKGVPRLLHEADSERLMRDVVEDLAVIGASERVDDALECILLKMACHGSVRAHQRLAPAEMKALLVELDRTPFNGNCPHGRPTFLRWSLAELERLFKRA
jgi:DNA mismatch repair protein MutL